VNIVDLDYPVINWIVKVNYDHLYLGRRALVLVRYKVYVYQAYKLDSQGQLCSPMLGEESFSFSKI
jgi:hypothetical protein